MSGLNSESLLEGLTEPQKQAVMHVDGPLLIVAGAGSGKTRVITRRVAHLISLGIPPASILAITFTNKAAGEMKERVSAVLERPLRDFGRLDQRWPTICTFHSLCLRILRHYATQVGLAPEFAIYDSSDQTKLIKDALKALDLSTTNFPAGSVHGAISNAKNQLLGPEQFAAKARDYFQKNVAAVYKKYQALLKQNNALDFDDLLLRTAQAFRDHPEVLRQLQERFGYILIDEYQDTNHAQYIIAHALAQKHRNICVVGDPDQSIYAWRGANIKNILEFERDYPDATVVKLEQNYRSTKAILAIASGLIARNVQRKEKGLWTENKDGEPARLFLCTDEHDEAALITRQLRELHDKHAVPWGDMAIFYRMNSLSRVIEESLFKSKVPYQIARGVEFYNRKEIKDVLAYMRLIANPADEVSLDRIANVPARGLSDATMKQMTAHAFGRGMSTLNAMREAAAIPGLTTRAANGAKAFVELMRRWRKMAGLAPAAQTSGGELESVEGGQSATTAASVQFPVVSDHATSASLLTTGHSPLATASSLTTGHSPPATASSPTTGHSPPATARVATARVRELIEDVVRSSGLETLFKKGDSEKEKGERAIDNVNELITSAAEFDADQPEGTLADYLAGVTLVGDTDRMNEAGGAITLMTLHAAKGLEFPVVVMAGLEDGVLPHSRARDNFDQLEEERRLCFVGITRAQEHLILTKAQFRTVRGLRERTITSQFLKEMPQDFLRVTDRTGTESLGGSARRSSREAPRETPPGGAGKFQEGQLVRHATFGMGRIKQISQAGQHTKAVVDFYPSGKKTLILEMAKLQIVG
jgi:DNA helicase-2/ATP-dependent DNA helicase PcrA